MTCTLPPNSLITSLPAENAVVVGAHFTAAVRKMRHMVRVRIVHTRSEAIVVLGHFTGAQAAACPLIAWLAEEFQVGGRLLAWAPFWAWSLELFVGGEVRPCPGSEGPIFRDDHQDGLVDLQRS